MPPHELADLAAAALDDHLSRLVRRLRQLQTTGELTQPESSALALVTRDNAMTVADLARAEDVRPQTMGAVVGSLERRGLLKRLRDRTDGRRVLITVTKAGRAVIDQGRSPRGDRLAEALSSGFTDEELEQLVGVAPLLGRLADRLS